MAEKKTKIGGDEKDLPKPAEIKNPELAVSDMEHMTIAPAQLRTRMALETERRKVITEYIKQNMKEGVDFGTITFETRTGKKVESKPTLFKPGSEKFCSLFSLQATFNKDFETCEMLGNQLGVVAFICTLKTKSGAIVGEGRGVADIREKQGWTANNCVKIAEKRAQIDAVLRSGGLSDFFTQDLEDQPDKTYKPDTKAPAQGYSASSGPRKVSQPQINFMNKLIGIAAKKTGKTVDELRAAVKKQAGIEHIADMPMATASQFIDSYAKKYAAELAQKPTAPEEVPTVQLDEEKGEPEEELPF